ncbi:dual specificity protein phosphatase [Spirulina sp. CS-785/01]|uniref:dual specificity protein phosphatase family protein n=1 Tax=Spirulina sp. CS-785/01 TaxID=3021716 RepID=UPI00232DA549|nr:dual specificity protein phosphatase [Spirulina sp. CS-785/01]MDB9314751.1 dual specificity protein phosphatase [Spirulina sp. CS-785/01]
MILYSQSGQNSHTIATIEQLSPNLDHYCFFYMLETFGAIVHLTSDYPPSQLQVQLWTNALNKYNSEGDWHGIDLPYQGQNSQGHYKFSGSFMPTSVGDYEFTYRVRVRDDGEWQWVGGLGDNGNLRVEPPSEERSWTQGASFAEVFPHVYVGNFIAASNAAEWEFDAVLNLAEELTLTIPEDRDIAYQKMPLRDGAQNSIPDEVLLDAVQWIDEQLQTGKEKILLHCRAGIGRSGSVGLAYYFAKHPDQDYNQCLEAVWDQKPDIYPHRHLKESLLRLFR